MSVTIVIAADSRLLTTQEALESELGVSVVHEQLDLFTSLLSQASSAVERFCRRIFAQQRYTEITPMVLDGRLLRLRMRPVMNVATVSYNGTAVTDFRIEDAAAGLLYRRLGWRELATEQEWTITYDAGYILPQQTNAPFVGGEALPGDIERATIEAIKVWYAERNPDQRVVSRHFSDQSISYQIQAGKSGLPKLSEQMLLRGGWRLVRVA